MSNTIPKAWLVSVSSGFLLGIGFIFPTLWWLCFVGLAPILFLYRVKTFTRFEAFWYAWLTGFILHLFALYAILWHTLPLDWFGVSSSVAEFVLIGGIWIFTAGTLALGTGLFGLLLKSTDRFGAGFVIVPLAWIISEWFGSFLFSIIHLGPDTLIGAHFTLGHIGYLLANDIVLLQAAWLGGVYALGFLVVFINVVLLECAFRFGKRERFVALCVVVALVPLCMIARSAIENVIPPTNAPLRLTLVATTNPSILYMEAGEEERRAEVVLSLLKNTESADILLIPEGLELMRYAKPEERDLLLEKFDMIVDARTLRKTGGEKVSRALFWYSDGPLDFSEKQFTLPLGEHAPYIYRALAAFAPEEFRTQFLRTRALISGEEHRLASLEEGSISVRFCNETMSPSLYASDTSRGAVLFANVASHGWFHGSHTVYEQMQTIAKVRAVESRRWYVQASNMVPSFAIDPYGHVVAETGWGEPGILTVSVFPQNIATPYTRLVRFF